MRRGLMARKLDHRGPLSNTLPSLIRLLYRRFPIPDGARELKIMRVDHSPYQTIRYEVFLAHCFTSV